MRKIDAYFGTWRESYRADTRNVVGWRPVKRVPFTIPGPLEVLRALPKVGMHLLLPAMVVGAVGGSLFDLLFGNDGYPLALVGMVFGPVGFAFAINGISRSDEAFAKKMAAYAESYRLAENEKRGAAAQERGELVRLSEHRDRRDDK